MSMDFDRIQRLISDKKYSELSYLLSKEIFASAELNDVDKSELLIYKHALFICPSLTHNMKIDTSQENIERFIKTQIKMVLHSTIIYPSEFES